MATRMTRQHFEAIAEAMRVTVKSADSGGGVLALFDAADNLAANLRKFNPNFDRRRFLIACGVPEDARMLEDK